MKREYYLSGINMLDELLGNNLSVEMRDGKGRYYRKMIIRRTSENFAEVTFRDCDGSRFAFVVCLGNGMASLTRPFLEGSAYEGILLRQLWACFEEMVNFWTSAM